MCAPTRRSSRTWTWPDAAHERTTDRDGAAGPSVDLAHPLDAGTPRLPIFPAPRFERIRSLPEHTLNLTRTEMVAHVGTHVDSPRHFFNDGPAFGEIPVTRLSGLGLVRAIRPGMAR